MPRSLTVPADVAEMIGPVKTAEITAGPHPAEYRCTSCRVRGMVNGAEPLVAGLDVHPDGAMRVWLAHKRCSPGGVRRIAHPLVHPDNTEVVGVFGAFGSPLFGSLPFLILEHMMYAATVPAKAPHGVGEVDEILAGYSRLGMEPARGINSPAAPHKAGWRIVLPRGRAARGGVFAPEGVTVMDTIPPIPAGWPELVAEAGGTCGLFVASRIGLNEVSRRGASHAVFEATVERAADAGRLMGITARVVTR